MRRSFPGGRRWPSGGFVYHKKIQSLPKPPDLAMALWRGGRAEMEPGAKVKPYEVIGYDHEGLPVHAPLGGKVREVGDFPHLLARPKQFDFPRLTVFIEVERKQVESVVPYKPLPRFWELAHRELCQRLLEAGVMDVCHQDLPRAVILNALDLEPPLSANLRLLEERTAQALEGMRILCQLHNAVRARLALPAGFPQLEARLRAMLASSVNLSLHLVEPVYPQGHTRLLNNEIFPEERCSIYDVTQAIRVQEAVTLGRPVVESFITVRNDCEKTIKNAAAFIGTPAGHVLWSDEVETKLWRHASAGEQEASPAVSRTDPCRNLSLIFGGLMSGQGYYSLEMPVQADTKGLLLIEQKRSATTPCNNCGACHQRCPVRLHPSEIYRQVLRLETKRLASLGLDKCLNCGLCSWVCPSKLDLLQQIAVGRMLLEGRL